MLTFASLRTINATRCKRWHENTPDWTGADWSNAMNGEAGEAANIVKKLRRLELGLYNAHPQLGENIEELIVRLGYEIADTVIYADLLANYYNIPLDLAIVEKFNIVSRRYGFPERLPTVNPGYMRRENDGTQWYPNDA